MTKEDLDFVKQFKDKYSIESIKILQINGEDAIQVKDNNKYFASIVDYEWLTPIVQNPVRHVLFCILGHVHDNRRDKWQT